MTLLSQFKRCSLLLKTSSSSSRLLSAAGKAPYNKLARFYSTQAAAPAINAAKEEDDVVPDEVVEAFVQETATQKERERDQTIKEIDEAIAKYEGIVASSSFVDAIEYDKTVQKPDVFFDGKKVPSPLFGIKTPTREDLEQANYLFTHHAVGLKYTAVSMEELPKADGKIPEVAFCGRSNVGKSSLINALLESDEVAHVSSVPGATKRVNLFSIENLLYIADTPGYGYAKGSKEKIAEWNEFLKLYVTQRNSLMRVYLLIDARLGITKTDREFLKVLADGGLSHQMVLTKCDEVEHSHLVKVMDSIYSELLHSFTTCFPYIIPTSSKKKLGLDELRASAFLASCLKERGILINKKVREIAFEKEAAEANVVKKIIKEGNEAKLKQRELAQGVVNKMSKKRDLAQKVLPRQVKPPKLENRRVKILGLEVSDKS